MSPLRPPLAGLDHCRVNNTLHGRSVHRPADVPGHNVFKGYNAPGTGDAVDLFCPAGSPVVAIADCKQTRHSNDATRLEVVYLEGDGWLAVYAHINAMQEGTGDRLRAGQVVGHVRGDLDDPHLHFELWCNGQAMHAPTPAGLRSKLVALMEPASPRLILAAGNPLWYKPVKATYDPAGRFDVDTEDLCALFGAAPLPEATMPIREALAALGLTAQFNPEHMGDETNPRMYALVTRAEQ